MTDRLTSHVPPLAAASARLRRPPARGPAVHERSEQGLSVRSPQRGEPTRRTKSHDLPEADGGLPVYVTPRQVARALKVDERTVLRWAAQDASMPVSRFGGRLIRFEQTAFLRWLERKKPRRAAAISANLAQAGS